MTIECYEFSREEIFTLDGINYQQRNIELINDATKKLQNISNIKNSIPLITHQIYLSSQADPVFLDGYNFRKTVNSIILLNNVNDSWKHIFWTNNPNIIPASIQSLQGVEIRLIEELKTSIIWDELTFLMAKADADKAIFAKASDFIRYAALNEFGGIYRDLDYEIIKPEEFLKLAQSFHFFGGKEFSFEPVYVGSALVASISKHPIIEGALQILKRNSNPDKSDLPEYLQYPCNKINQQIYETGPAVITMAFYKFANQPGYHDLLLPADILFNWDYARKLTPDSSCYQADLNIKTYNQTIGYDLFCGAWHKNKGFFDRISYSKKNILKEIAHDENLPKAFVLDCYTDLNKEIFAQEGINFDLKHQEIRQNNLDKIAYPEKYALNQSNPIPAISHHIYLTSIIKPKAINELNLNKTISSINRLNEVNDSWKHIFWTNNHEIVPDVIKDLKNLEIHLIEEFSNHNLWDNLNILLAEVDTNPRAFSGASDLIRYAALEIYGGVYHDLDYEIFSANKLYALMQAFNFLGGKELEKEWSYMGNSFLASSANHPIIKMAITLIERNLHLDQTLLPEYLQYPCSKFNVIMYSIGPAMITIAFYKAANQDGNIDLLALPNQIFFNTPYIHYITPNSFCSKPNQPVDLINNINGTKIETIGADMWCAPWPDSYMDPIYYAKNVNSYLYMAAQNGDLNLIKDYIAHGANINAQHRIGFNPVYVASKNKHQEVVEFLIQQGAELNMLQANGKTPLSIAIENQDLPMVKLLIAGGAQINEQILALSKNIGNQEIMTIILNNSLTSQSNNNIECYANHIDEIFAQEGFDYQAQEKLLAANYQQKIKEIDQYIASNSAPIPFKTHQVYLTSLKDPKQMDNISKNKTITTIKRLNDESPDWQHFIWSNSVNIPKEILSLHGVKLRLIDEFKDNILWNELAIILENAQEHKYMFAEGSDIVRMLALNKEGGIYRDLDNEIYQAANLIKLISAYQFIGGKEFQDEKSYIGNAFLASIPNHPIINTTIELIARNFNQNISSLPEYLQYPCNIGIKVIYNTGSVALTTAYFKEANQGGNIDIIAPGNVFFNRDYARKLTPESRCHNPSYIIDSKIAEIIAGDPFCGSWQSLEAIYYSKNKDSLLYQAASSGDLALFNKALKDGADVNKVQLNDVNPLSIAANKGYVNIVKLLLENGANTEIPGNGYTPLYWATQEKHPEIVKILIEAKADVNAKQINGASILYLAVDRKLTEIAKLLLASNADTESKFNGKTALMLAQENAYDEISKLLLNHKLFKASSEGNYSAALEAIDLGAEIDSTHISNATSLYIAARRGHDQIVKLLIDKGAQVDLPIASGDTALYAAASEGYTKITKLLLDAGANKDIIIHGYSPLVIAAHFERVDDVNLLLEYGANIISDNPYTAFNIAQFKHVRTEKGNIIYQNILDHYLNSLNNEFEVVIARYNEDLDWAVKEFPHAKVTVYNKGLPDLKLPHNFQVIPLENTGREAHTYFHHIINNYHKLAEKTLFLQGHPYEHPLFLPLIRYKDSLNSTCANIIAKCSPSHPTLVEKANDIKSQLERNFKGFKAAYDLIEFTHKFIDGQYDPNSSLYTINGAQFAVERQNILTHSKEYYQKLQGTLLHNINPVEGFYLERLWDIVFTSPESIMAKNNSQEEKELSFTPSTLITTNQDELNKDLFQAATDGNLQEASKLLAMGAEINSKHDFGTTALTAASFSGHKQVVKLLLDQHPNINSRGNNGLTALYAATSQKHIEIMKLLLASGANTELTIASGTIVDNRTPLYIAIANRDIEAIKLLLQYNANILSDDINTPLYIAAINADIERGKTATIIQEQKEIYEIMINHYWQWLEHNPALTAAKDFEVVVVRYQEDDLSWLIKEFPNEKVTIYNKGNSSINPEYLLDTYKLVNINNFGWFGGTILHHIVHNYDHLANRTLFLQAAPYAVELFLPLARYKDDLPTKCQNIIAKCVYTTLQHENEQFIYQSRPENWNNTKYHHFKHLDYNMIDFVHQYIEPDYSANSQLAMVWGAEFAVDSSHVYHRTKEYYQNIFAKFQIQYPTEDFYLEKLWDLVFASPSASLNELLFKAATDGDLKEASKLLSMGADVNYQNPEGTSILHAVTAAGHIIMASLLLSKGANINVLDKVGATPLCIASVTNNIYITELLITMGADVNLSLEPTNTPLWGAVKEGNMDIIKLLVESGAEIYSDKYMDPLALAAKLKKYEIHEYLLEQYQTQLKQNNANLADCTNIPDDNKFEVVITRYNEDISWIANEFPCHKVTIYNKGNDLPSSPYYQEVKLPNVGYLGGTYLYHIVHNYNNLADRTLFIQANPYDAYIFLPLARFQGELNSTCNNIIAKCDPGHNLQAESLAMQQFDWENGINGKYKNFNYQNNDLIKFAEKFITAEIPERFPICYGAQFAIDKDIILRHKQEFYLNLTNALNYTKSPIEDFYLERLWDLVFASPSASLNELLFQAATDGDLKEASKLLSMGADVNYQNPEGTSILHAVTAAGHIIMAGLLLSKGANINALDKVGGTPLCIASVTNNIYITELLITMGADVNLSMEQINSPLWLAVSKGNMDIIKLLVESGAEIYSDKYMDPLALAAKLKKYEIHEYLLEQYQTQLKQNNANLADCTNIPDDNKFEVVIARYNEDISWIANEFPCHKVTIYNKGNDLPSSPYYQEVKLPNLGYGEGSYFYHIVHNYNNLADRTLFIQANPYDAYIFLPLARFQGELNSTCNNIIAKCEPGHNLQAESLKMQQFDWENGINGKYKNFNYQNNDLMKFAEKFITAEIPERLPICYAGLFAIDKETIFNHDVEHYQDILDALNYSQYPIEAFYLERLWDLVFI